MAEAGLNRLGLSENIKFRFPLEYFIPAAGQGALAVITRKDSKEKETLQKLNHYFSFQEVLSEKIILEEIGVGCQWPIGAKDKHYKCERGIQFIFAKIRRVKENRRIA